MSGLQLENVFEHCAWPRHVPECEIEVKCLAIHFPWNLRMLKERFDLRRKNEEVFAGVVIDRLYAKAVPDEKKPFLATIPNRECKHPAKIAHTIIAIFFIRMNNGFRIRP